MQNKNTKLICYYCDDIWRVIVNTTTVPHDHQSVTIRIELPRKVNTCSPLVSISPGNRAGTSLPTEIEVGKLHYMLMGTTKVGSDFWGLGFTFFVCVFFFFFFFFQM